MHNLLKKYFGFEQFRPLQEDIITHVLKQQDCLVLMPTGGGKSLCFQLPALALPGLTLVISPLIALMKDQVDQLNSNGIAAAFLNSTLTFPEIIAVQTKAKQGELKILYIAPERLAAIGFMNFLQSLNTSLIAIDEAHCISEWGHDFRPDYRTLKLLRAQFAHVPIIALTATATEKVRIDILQQLNLRQPRTFISSFNRPNLTYSVYPKKDAFPRLLELLKRYHDESVIIYCFSRKDTEQLAELLNHYQFKAAPYHAGLTNEVRKQTQEQFIRDQINIITATIAFGMGIDKPDVRLVVHQDLPKSVEGYYQETGRAGRDGLPAECALFFSYADKRKQAYFINQISNVAEREKSWQQLEQVLQYGSLQQCRRGFLLRYFGEQYQVKNCAACDVCKNEVVNLHAETASYDTGLFNELRTLRKQLAEQLGVPPYIIFGNASLQEMATYFPQSEAALINITGVGNTKLTQFGKVFLDVIRAYAKKNNLTEKIKSNIITPIDKLDTFIYKDSTYDKTKQLLLQKLALNEIAKQRQLSVGTIISHIEKLVKADPQMDITYLKPIAPRLKIIAPVFQQTGGLALSPVRAILGEDFSYDELRLARLFLPR
ncbi:MAG: RecQ family ATP-dependent DNA helicase [Patescibacteria group bacterium]